MLTKKPWIWLRSKSMRAEVTSVSRLWWHKLFFFSVATLLTFYPSRLRFSLPCVWEKEGKAARLFPPSFVFLTAFRLCTGLKVLACYVTTQFQDRTRGNCHSIAIIGGSDGEKWLFSSLSTCADRVSQKSAPFNYCLHPNRILSLHICRPLIHVCGYRMCGCAEVCDTVSQ